MFLERIVFCEGKNIVLVLPLFSNAFPDPRKR